jgi:hypothetical protein
VFEGKAGADDKAQHTRREYVSILKRPSTQPSGARWGFEMASILFLTRKVLQLNKDLDKGRIFKYILKFGL